MTELAFLTSINGLHTGISDTYEKLTAVPNSAWTAYTNGAILYAVRNKINGAVEPINERAAQIFCDVMHHLPANGAKAIELYKAIVKSGITRPFRCGDCRGAGKHRCPTCMCNRKCALCEGEGIIPKDAVVLLEAEQDDRLYSDNFNAKFLLQALTWVTDADPDASFGTMPSNVVSNNSSVFTLYSRKAGMFCTVAAMIDGHFPERLVHRFTRPPQGETIRVWQE